MAPAVLLLSLSRGYPRAAGLAIGGLRAVGAMLGSGWRCVVFRWLAGDGGLLRSGAIRGGSLLAVDRRSGDCPTSFASALHAGTYLRFSL